MAFGYAIPAQSIIELRFNGTLHSQRTITVLHYRNTQTIEDGADGLNELITHYRENVLLAMLATASPEFRMDNIQAQYINPQRFQAVQQDVNQIGTGGIDSNPTTVTTVIRYKAQRAGKKFQGRSFLPAVPKEFERDSKLTDAAIIKYNAFQSALNSWDDISTPRVVQQIWTAGQPGDIEKDVAYRTVDPILRVQRRREVGVGQ